LQKTCQTLLYVVNTVTTDVVLLLLLLLLLRMNVIATLALGRMRYVSSYFYSHIQPRRTVM